MNMLDEGTAKRTSLQISEELARLGAELRSRLRPGHFLRRPVDPQGQARPALDIYADVILNPSFPEVGFPEAAEDPDRRIAPGEGLAHRHGAPGPAGASLRRRPRLRHPVHAARATRPPSPSSPATTWSSSTRPGSSRASHAGRRRRHDPGRDSSPSSRSSSRAGRGARSRQEHRRRGAQRQIRGRLYHRQAGRAPVRGHLAGHAAAVLGRPRQYRHRDHEPHPGRRFHLPDQHEPPRGQALELRGHVLLCPAPGASARSSCLRARPGGQNQRIDLEIAKELEGILGQKPVTPDEFNNVKASQVLQLPGQWETMAAVQGSLSEMVQYGLPDDYFQKYPARVRSLRFEDVAKAAAKTVHPDSVRGSWSATGPRSSPRSGSSGSPRSTSSTPTATSLSKSRRPSAGGRRRRGERLGVDRGQKRSKPVVAVGAGREIGHQ